jgi:hypothetical protein
LWVFYFPKKPNLFVFFWEIKKTKFFERIWVFMLGQDPLIGMHEVNPDLFTLV